MNTTHQPMTSLPEHVQPSNPRENKLGMQLEGERGQVLPMVAILMIGFLGMCGFVVDSGRVYIGYRQLQSATDAAALAGAQSLPNTTAITAANAYSAINGSANQYSNLANVTMASGYPMTKCLSTLAKQGLACQSPTNANAITVKEQVSVPMYFGKLFGTSSITLTATSTAAMGGGTSTPYNVVIIVDTTGSMGTYDSGDCNNTRLQCALQGVQVLLQNLSPCGASMSSCGAATNGNVANSVDRVSLFTFPNMTDGTVSKEYDCSSTNPTTTAYTFPSAVATSYAPTTSTYRVTPFQSDYRTSDTTSTLNTSSNLTLAVAGKSGCTGMTNPGGFGTYYAGVLYAAQAALLDEQANNPGSQNVLILLSDGDATATSAQMGAGSSTTTGLYPSSKNECQQAITAAQAIAAAGTEVYAVAYGASSSGCATDTSGSLKGLSPCQAMQNIASNPAYFFSDSIATQNSGQCISASQPTTSLNQIFQQITTNLGGVRLIPDNTP